MKNMVRQVFHSPRFVIGFVIFVVMLLMIIFYPLLVRDRSSEHGRRIVL